MRPSFVLRVHVRRRPQIMVDGMRLETLIVRSLETMATIANDLDLAGPPYASDVGRRRRLPVSSSSLLTAQVRRGSVRSDLRICSSSTRQVANAPLIIFAGVP